MRRTSLAAFGCVALFSLSCGVGQVSPATREREVSEIIATAVVPETTPDAPMVQTEWSAATDARSTACRSEL